MHSQPIAPPDLKTLLRASDKRIDKLFPGQVAVSPKAAGLAIDKRTTDTYRKIWAGTLPSYKDGKSRKVLVSGIKEYLKQRLIATMTGKVPPHPLGQRRKEYLARKRLAATQHSPPAPPRRPRKPAAQAQAEATS